MPFKTEKELVIFQKINKMFDGYDVEHLQDASWFRKKWVTEEIKRRYGF